MDNEVQGYTIYRTNVDRDDAWIVPAPYQTQPAASASGGWENTSFKAGFFSSLLGLSGHVSYSHSSGR